MKLDVNVEFKRSILAGIAMVCATVALCLKAISPIKWGAAMTAAFGSYTAIRTTELVAERKAAANGNGGQTVGNIVVAGKGTPTQ